MQATLEAPAAGSSAADIGSRVIHDPESAGIAADQEPAADPNAVALATAVLLGLGAGIIAAAFMMLGAGT